MSEASLFLLAAQELQRYAYAHAHEHVRENARHASVAMIFVVNRDAHSVEFRELFEDLSAIKKINMIEHPSEIVTPYASLRVLLRLMRRVPRALQVVFIQRADAEKDLHSGQIAFPGGHVEAHAGENDFQAAVRETHEEIGFDLCAQDVCALYVGKFPKHFYVRKTRTGETLYVGAHVFLVRDAPQFHAHAGEVQDVRLVDFSTFTNFAHESFAFKETPFYAYAPPRALPRFLAQRYAAAKELVSHSAMPAVNVGMRQPLWGLTLYLVVYLLTVVDAAAAHSKHVDKRRLTNMRRLISLSRQYKLEFKTFSLWAVLLDRVVRGMIRKVRWDEYTYACAHAETRAETHAETRAQTNDEEHD